jgi:sarcosine oxidase subunit gamma
MGPDEWMLVAEASEAREREIQAREALSGIHHQLVDVSDYYTIIEVAGSKARELLAKLTTLDLHPRAFRVGMVAGSVFGRANAMIWQTADDGSASGPEFSVFIRWSMADYLWCAIANAGQEWGLPEEVPVKGERLTID